jgi:PAS domain S-box-containing protein
LLFELLLLGSVYTLWNQAENAAREAEHTKMVIARTKQVVQLFFDVGLAFVVYDAKTTPMFERRFTELYDRIPVDLSDLAQLVRDNPKHKEIVEHVTEEARQEMRSLAESKRLVEAGGRFNIMEAIRMKQHLMSMVSELNQISEEEERSGKSNPETAERLKALVKQLLLSGVVMSIVIALSLVAVFHQSTTRRLNSLMDNSRRLGMREELAPVLTGDDELAKLDGAFHKAAIALAEYARKERAVIDNALDVICSLDSQGRFTAVSPASEKLWGFKPEELLGKGWSELAVDQNATGSIEWIEIVRSRSEAVLESVIRRKDGKPADMLWSAHWSEPEQSLFCVVHDETERKKLERFKQQFVEMISHDLRTPLSAVQSTLEVLGSGAWGEISERAHGKVDRARENIGQSINLINNLLDLERMESGSLEISLEDVLLEPLLERCVEAVGQLAEKRDIAVRLAATSAVVKADCGRLSQVVLNFLGNALKFSPDKSEVIVHVRKDGQWVQVGVTDQGPGVPEAYQKRIFERFQQAPGDESAKLQGTGLGLAICKLIMDAHGGSIGIESQEGQGSTFWFRVRAAGMGS